MTPRAPGPAAPGGYSHMNRKSDIAYYMLVYGNLCNMDFINSSPETLPKAKAPTARFHFRESPMPGNKLSILPRALVRSIAGVHLGCKDSCEAYPITDKWLPSQHIPA